MKQRIFTTANILSVTLIILGIFVFLFIHPFIYSYIGIIEQGKTNIRNTKWDKLAVKYSIFKKQKKFTINAAMPSLILSKEYSTAVEYLKKLEDMDIATARNYYFASYASEQLKDYNKALEYAKKSNDQFREAKVYIKMKNFNNAQNVLDNLAKEKPVKPRVYLYDAELKMAQNKWPEANTSINKFLKINPNSKEALQDKAEISKQLGNMKDYNNCINKLKNIETKLENRIN